MAEEKQIKTYVSFGVIALVSLLAGFFGKNMLTEDQFENTFVCTVTEEYGIFYGGISKSGLTAYPFSENRTKYTRCAGGEWITLKEYAKLHNIDPSEIIIKEQKEEVNVEPKDDEHSFRIRRNSLNSDIMIISYILYDCESLDTINNVELEDKIFDIEVSTSDIITCLNKEHSIEECKSKIIELEFNHIKCEYDNINEQFEVKCNIV